MKEPYPKAADAGLTVKERWFRGPFRNGDWAFPPAAVERWHDQLLYAGPLISADNSQALAEGFVLGGAEYAVNLRSASGKAVTVTDIRPVNIAEECLPTELALLTGNEGDSEVAVEFDLDAARPLAHAAGAGPSSTSTTVSDTPSTAIDPFGAR